MMLLQTRSAGNQATDLHRGLFGH